MQSFAYCLEIHQTVILIMKKKLVSIFQNVTVFKIVTVYWEQDN